MKKPTNTSERLARLEERRRALQSQISREQNRLLRQERAERAKRLIKLGELIEATGLLMLDKPLLIGALLEIADNKSDPACCSRWSKLYLRHAQEQQTLPSDELESDAMPSDEDEPGKIGELVGAGEGTGRKGLSTFFTGRT